MNKRQCGPWLALTSIVALAACGSGKRNQTTTPPPVLEGKATLSIAPALQQTPVWCWAACAEMVFRHYRMPNLNGAGNFQCGIVAAWFQGVCLYDCSQCVRPIGVMSNMAHLVLGYGAFAQGLGVPSRILNASLVTAPVGPDLIKREIDAGRPIVLGITPGPGFALPNASQHIAVLVGYDFTDGRRQVVINDPFPFDLPPYSAYAHPYLVTAAGTRRQVGQFVVEYQALLTALRWANTIVAIG